MRYLALAILAAGLGGTAVAGEAGGPVVMSDADLAAVVAGHNPGIANQIEPEPFQDRLEGKRNPSDNGHAGVEIAQGHGGTGNHPVTGTTFAGPDHPLID